MLTPFFHSPASATALEIPPVHAEVFTLDNGLTVILEEDRSAPVVSVQVWCETGSIHEDRWLGAGISHLVEHMLFKGTESRQAGDIAREIQDVGGYVNAYTSFDRTVYWVDAPSDGTSTAIEVLADAVLHSTLPEEEFIKELDVIRREFAMGFDDPNRQGIQLLLRTAYQQSPFRHPIIGHLDFFNQITREDALEYFRERYAPENLTFIVVGDIDRARVRAQIEELFGKIPRRGLTPLYLPSEPRQMGRREAHEEFATDLTRLYMAWHVPGMTSPDAPALDVLGLVLGSGRSSILNQKIREQDRLAHSVGAGVFSLPNQGLFYVSAVTDPDKREAAEKGILAEMARVKAEGVSQEEVAKAKRSLLADQLQSLTTARGRAAGHGSNWMLARNLDFGRHYLERLESVTPEDVQRVAKQYLLDEQLTVASLNPQGSLQQTALEIADSARGEIQKFELSNGLRLLVCEDPRLPLVSATAVFRGGLLLESPENNGITQVLSRSMLKGTANRSAVEIAHEIESLGGSIGSDAGNNTFSVSVDMLSPDLATGLEILADVVLRPSFPENEVELEKSTQVASIKAEDDQITAIARNLLRSELFQDHPYALRSSGSAEAVQSLTPDHLRTLHAQTVTSSNGVISVVGAVRADEVKRLAEEYFGKLPGGDIKLREVPQPPTPDQKTARVSEVDKQQAVIMIGYRGAGVTDADRPALELIDAACSDLGSRFFNTIREERGLAYFVGSSQMLGLAPGLFVFYVGTDPAKVDEASDLLRQEIAGLAKSGLTEEELNRAKKKLLGAESIRNQGPRSFGLAAALNETIGLGYNHYQQRQKEIESVTLADIQRVARKYFADQHPVEVVVRPPEQTP